MTKKFRCLSLIVCAVALASCSDAGNPAAPPLEPSRSEEEIPPEYSQGPALRNYWTDVGFDPDYAYGIAYMEYYGNRAKQILNLTLRRDGNVVMSAPPAESEQHPMVPSIPPNYRSMYTTSTIGVASKCGHQVDGYSSHSAWHEFFTKSGGVMSWEKETQPSNKSAAQSGTNVQNKIPTWNTAGSLGSPGIRKSTSTCDSESGSTGGGSTGGGWSCTTVYFDHYWYYPDTGTYEYRYTSSKTTCTHME